MMNEEKLVQLQQFAKRVRNHIVPMASDGGFFLGASLSAVDLLTYLYVDHLNLHKGNLNDENRDSLIVSDFKYEILDEEKNKMTGEILIGVGVARRHAKKARHLLKHELTLYLIHGLLHLCGFDDMDPVSRKNMRKRERFYLSRLGLPDIAPLQ